MKNNLNRDGSSPIFFNQSIVPIFHRSNVPSFQCSIIPIFHFKSMLFRKVHLPSNIERIPIRFIRSRDFLWLFQTFESRFRRSCIAIFNGGGHFLLNFRHNSLNYFRYKNSTNSLIILAGLFGLVNLDSRYR